MLTVDFLRHVLPDEGWICIATALKKGFRHRFFQSFEQAADYIQQQDAAGETVYYACATYQTPDNRKQVNVAALKSIFGDVDVGPDKAYKTRAQASAALTALLLATGLPIPTIVYSGAWGMHLYWVLDALLTPSEWKPAAEAFRDLCKAHGFHLDHTRTADSSSVLRPPGTHNRKRGSAEPVTVAHVSEPLWLADLSFRGLQPHVRHRALISHSLLEGASAYSELPSDAHKIVAACAQIRNLRDMEGSIPYNLWLYSIWTLHFTTEGDEIAHEWSKGHPKYTREETQRKLDEARSPITCKRFAEHNDLCKTCPYWDTISTPLQLGRELMLPTAPAAQQRDGADVGKEGPSVYNNSTKGLWLCSEKKDKKGNTVSDDTLISKWPITLSSICRGERDRNFSLVFTMTMPQIGELAVDIPAGEFFSPRGVSVLADKGAVIHHHEYFRDYVRKEMDIYNSKNAPQTRYSQFGWKDLDNSFLYGSKLYTQSQIIPVSGAPEIERRARMLGPRKGGSLARWRSAANQLFAVGCEPHSFALCCAFGAPLMRFLSEEEGGAILNLVSETSATGKTTGLEAVASVWGELDGLRLLDEDTQISRGVFLGTLGNLPCVFDELHKRDPDSIRSFVTMFTSGRDKLRAKADGTLRDPSGDWQTILILGSNISLTDIMQSKNSEEAQTFRILELIVEQNFVGHEGDKLRRQLHENSGWAADAYVKYLMQSGVMETTRARLDEAVEKLWHPRYGFEKKHRFWVRLLASALVAGEIATHVGIVEFDVQRILKWVIERAQERRDSDIKRDNVQILNEALYELWACTLAVDVEWKPKTACMVLAQPSPNRAFLARRVRDSGRMYIMRTWLRKWLTARGINRTAFTRDLIARHVIVCDAKYVTLGAGTDQNSGGQIVCYEIDLFHPEMTGALEAAERDVPMTEREKKPINVLRFPGGAVVS